MLKQISLNDSDPLNSKEVEYIKNKLRTFSEPINSALEEKDDFEIKDFFPVVDDKTLSLYLRLKMNGTLSLIIYLLDIKDYTPLLLIWLIDYIFYGKQTRKTQRYCHN